MKQYTAETGSGRFDVDGNEWFACDPYPTWYRWVNGELITPVSNYSIRWRDG